MLAAAPNRDSSLGLFTVVLRSVEDPPAVAISDSLKTHAINVLNAALRVASDPKAIEPDTPAEAIELAYLIERSSVLRGRLSNAPEFENIPVDLARDLLRSLQALAA